MRFAKLAALIVAAAGSITLSPAASAAPQSGGVTANPTSFNFGDVILGGEDQQPFIVTNGTAADITITDAMITPAGSQSYAVQNMCPSDLQANGGACVVYVTFQPVSVGVKKYSLAISTSTGTFTIPLTGTGLPTPMVLKPPSLDFGSAVVGVSSKQSTTLTNTGNFGVSVLSVKVVSTESYTQTNDCSVELAAGASCTISVTYDPISAGVKNFAIHVTTDAWGTQTLPLTGTATASPISVVPSSIAFGTVDVGVAASTSVAVKNVSSTPVTFSNIGVTPVGTESYTQTNDCPTTIAADGTCTIKITFDPVSVGVKNYSVSLADNVGTQVVRLTGTAVASPIQFLPANGLFFGTQPIGHSSSQPVIIQNNSAAAVAISRISITPAGSQSYSLTNDCGNSVAAENYCAVTVGFDPVSTGMKNYSLTVVDSAGTQTIPITGTGNQASLPDLAYGAPSVLSAGGMMPVSVVVADFNGDGKLDFAVANENSKSISVFLNDGNGAFASPIITTVETDALNISVIIAADFNKDNKQDLLVSAISGNQADYVLLGKGDGTFTQLAAIPGSSGFVAAAVGDINGDGKLDYVAGGAGTLSYHLGNGDGTFQAVVTMPNINGTFSGVALGDFNGDKKLDIAAVYPAPYDTGSLVVLLGNGDGTFQSAVTQEVDDNIVVGLQAGDFNGDGKLDLLFDYDGFADVGYGDGSGHFSVGGNGSVAALLYYGGILNIDNFVHSRATDFDGDSKPDVIAGGYNSGNMNIVLNPGIGTFPFPLNTSMTLPLAPTINDIAVGDLNGDKVPDIVAVNGQTNQVTVFLSKKPQ